MEIVTLPDLRSGAEAAAFVRHLILLLKHIGTCDGNLAGGLACLWRWVCCDRQIEIAAQCTSPARRGLAACGCQHFGAQGWQ